MLSARQIPHDAPRESAVTPAISVEYGAYLAKATGCQRCHKSTLVGGEPPFPGAPLLLNITPDPESGLGNWSETDFFRALREGKRPDNSEIDPAMPLSLGNLSDEELKAIWLYLQSIEPTPVKHAQK